jgi:hypothetical protein
VRGGIRGEEPNKIKDLQARRLRSGGTIATGVGEGGRDRWMRWKLKEKRKKKENEAFDEVS